jgi:hypothetical protein
MKTKCSAFDAKENGTSSYRCASKVQQNTIGDHGNSMLTSEVGNIKPSLKHGHKGTARLCRLKTTVFGDATPYSLTGRC